MTALLAQSKDNAQELVDQIIRDYARGLSDRLPEAIALADLWCLEIDVLSAAKEAREAREAVVVPLVQPKTTRRLLTAKFGKAEEAAEVGKVDWVALAKRATLNKPAPVEVAEPVAATFEPVSKAKPKYSADVYRPAPLPPENATALDRLTYPRGLLGHAVQYIVDTADLPDRWIALAGALCALGKGLDRKVLGPHKGNSVVLYLLLIGETSAGKQHAINCIRLLLRAMGHEEIIASGGIASVQSIEEVLEGKGENKPPKPSSLVIVDEYGSFLTRIMSKNQVGNVSEIPATLQTLWGWSPQIEWQGSMKVGKQHIVVYGPAFFIFGTSTPKTFFTSLKSKQVSSGFVNRHLLFNVGRGAEELADEERDIFSIPDWLAEALKEVAGEVAPLDNRPLKNGLHIVRDWRRIGWGEGARAKWREYWGQATQTRH